ncbi:HAMP domain-containing sensor histidine kinase [Kitasatospora nipponensis]|uniref:histidine kinase n=1 Tax=Kitasatospora nipponensis TaxID=258049 RepID=A0ABN1W4J4_9ACTN
MRATLALVALTVTSMVALSFVVPLALLLGSQARTAATDAAQRRAAAVAPLLALAAGDTGESEVDQAAEVRAAVRGADFADRLCVHLPTGELIGSPHAPAVLLDRAIQRREAVGADAAGGWDYLQPVLLDRGRVAVVEEFVPQAELSRGVATGRAVLALLVLGLVLGSVLVADRLGARMVRASRGLSSAANALGAGDLEIRVTPAGPRELHEAGAAFNAMADRITRLMAAERELIADLSHRLRTPLTALRLAGEQIGPVRGADRLAAAVHQIESEVDSIIVAARAPQGGSPSTPRSASPFDPWPLPPSGAAGEPVCEVAEATRRRVGFWSVLAAQQGRDCRFSATDEPTPVPVSQDDLAAVVDALVGNVFRHTPQGTGFAVGVQRTAQSVVLVVEDAGAGIADPHGAPARAMGVGGSTGLGLDIARRTAASTRGHLSVLRSELGGARIQVVFGLAEPPRRGLGAPWRHRRRRPAETLLRGRS